MDEWPILEDNETYLPPDVARMLMFVDIPEEEGEMMVARLRKNMKKCMNDLAKQHGTTLTFEEAGDAETIQDDKGNYADILRGISMESGVRKETDDEEVKEMLRSMVIHSDSGQFRTFLFSLISRCVGKGGRRRRTATKKRTRRTRRR